MLTEAAINGAKDHLIGLKENVIIGKLIPAGTGAPANVAARREADRRRAAEALAGGELPAEFGSEYNPFLEDVVDGGADDDTARLSALLAAADAPRGGRGRARGRGRRRRVQPVPGRCQGGVDSEIASLLGDLAGDADPDQVEARTDGASCSLRHGPDGVFDTPRRPAGTLPACVPRPVGRGRAAPRASCDGVRPAGPPEWVSSSTTRTPRKGQRLRADDQPARAPRPEAEDREGQGPGDAQDLEQPRPAPDADSGRPPEARRLPAGAHDDAEEAELGPAQDRPRPALQPDGGHGLHPGDRPQPPGALRRARSRRAGQGPPVGQVPHHPRRRSTRPASATASRAARSTGPRPRLSSPGQKK